MEGLRISSLLKTSLRSQFLSPADKYLQTLQLINKNQKEQLMTIDSEIHKYIDSKITFYFPQSQQKELPQDLIQRAILLKVFQKILMGNIEEAKASFKDSIRFGQINKDINTMSMTLIYLAQIYLTMEDFSMHFKTIEEFFSKVEKQENPLLVYEACMLFLECKKEFTPFKSKKELNDLRNKSFQMNQIAKLHMVLRDIQHQKEEMYFQPAERFFWKKNSVEKYDKLMYGRLFEINSQHFRQFQSIYDIVSPFDFSPSFV